MSGHSIAYEIKDERTGGTLLAGLDPTGIGGTVAGFGDQRELELLVEAGFTPLEALKISSLNGAQFLGEQDHIGSLAAGKQADIAIVKGDPSAKIDDIENGVYAIVGSPETVRQKLAHYQKELGAGVILTGCQTGTLSHELARKSMELLAREVLPKIRI